MPADHQHPVAPFQTRQPIGPSATLDIDRLGIHLIKQQLAGPAMAIQNNHLIGAAIVRAFNRSIDLL